LVQLLMMKEWIPSEPINLNFPRSLISALTSSTELVDVYKKSEFTKRGEILDEE